MLALALHGTPAGAHVVVGAETVDRLLTRVTSLAERTAADVPAPRRASALFDLGEALARVTELLNRDLAAHGGRLGLAAEALVRQLKARGFAPEYSRRLQRYRTRVEPFETALALAPDSPRAADARFRLLAAGFYESFSTDPFRLEGLDWQGLLTQIDEARAFLARYPAHPGREEAAFILAVDYARAARLAPDAAARRRYEQRARDALLDFVEAYPDGVRAATAQILLDSLPAAP